MKIKEIYHIKLRWLGILFMLLPLFTSCIREEEFNNSPQGNFEALWKIIDEQYCFLDYKQIDWNAIHDKYQPLITSNMPNDGLFQVLDSMLAELKDGHVNLYSSSNMGPIGIGTWIIHATSTRVSSNGSILERITALPVASNIKSLKTTLGISITNHSPMASATVIWTKFSPTLLHVAD